MTDTNIQFPQVHLDKMIEAARTFDALRPGSHQWRFDGVSNFDAAESVFTARQLEYMRPGIYMVEFPELKAKRLIPFNTSIPTGAETYLAQRMEQVGKPKVSRDYGTDTPMVNVKTTEVSMGFFAMRLGYTYSLQEARNAIYARRPLNQAKAIAVKEEMERELDSIAFLGNEEMAVKGLLNQSGTLTYATPATGAGGAKTFDSKDSDAVLLDLNSATYKVVTDSKEIEIPNTMLLPVTTYTLISSRRIGDGTSSTILRYYIDNQPHIKTVESTYKLESHATDWTGKRGVVYRRDPNRLEMVVPQPFEQLPPIAKGFVVETLCHMRTGGLNVMRPKSILYFDEI